MQSLRNIRKQKGLTIDEVATLVGLTPVALNLIELGRSTPGATTRRKIQRLFDEPVNWLEVPRIETEPLRPATWNECEREFRWLIRLVNGMPHDRKQPFIRCATKHLRKLNKNIGG